MSETGAAAPPAASDVERPWRGGPLAAVEIKPDLPFAARLIAVLTLAGLLLGVLWWLLAPTVPSVIGPDGTAIPLSEGDSHPFGALIIFLAIASVAGTIAGLACWQLRRRRGPVALFALGIGCLLATGVAAGIGELLVRITTTSGKPGDQVRIEASVGSPWVVLVQPLFAILIYTFLAAWNGRDDLGRSR